MDNFFEGLKNIAITICDKDGKIIDMNQHSADVNSKGAKIIGNDLYACHPAAAQQIIHRLMDHDQLNAYTIEKNGIKKLIYQTPWYDENHQLAGLIEFSIEIPFEMPHYVRTPKPNAQ